MATWKDAANPFNKLITSVTHDDNYPNVPYYQTEQVKDAAFQSENGAESIHKALIYRLEHGTPIVQHKCLFLVRMLMLEGPAGFASKMSSQMGKVNSLANADVRKNSVEEQVKSLAGAIQQAVNGDAKALTRVGSTGQQDKETKQQALKSDFQLEQERQMKAYKAQRKRGTSEVMVNEKLLQQFDSSLVPNKFVSSALHSDKKKYNQDELVAFNQAAHDTSSVSDVAAALDNNLRDGSLSLAIRYKALQLADALLSDPEGDAMKVFRSRSQGIQRHMTIERSDNPTKSQLTQSLAQTIMSKIQNANEAAIEANKMGSGNFQSFDSPQSTSAAANLDDMFGGMQVNEKKSAQNNHNSWASTNENSTSWGQPQPQHVKAPSSGGLDDQMAQFQKNMMMMQQMMGSSAQQSVQSEPAAPAQPMVQPHRTQDLGVVTQQPVQSAPPPAPPAPQAPAPPPAPPAPPTVVTAGQPDLAAQMAQFQKNMMVMQQMIVGQQSSAPPGPAPQNQQPPQTDLAPAWGSTAVAPPPIPEATSFDTTVSPERRETSRSPDAGVTEPTPIAQSDASINPSPESTQPKANAEAINALQAQMAETQKIMLKQQEMLAKLMAQQGAQ